MRWMDTRRSRNVLVDCLWEKVAVWRWQNRTLSEPSRLQERAPWASLPNKPLGRLVPSQFATLQPFNWNLGHLALPVAHQGCHLAALLEALHAILLCSSASCWWIVVLRCSAASPWHTHPGTATDLMPSVLFKTSFVIKVTGPPAVAASHAVVI